LPGKTQNKFCIYLWRWLLNWYADAPPGRKVFVSSGMSFMAAQSGVVARFRQ